MPPAVSWRCYASNHRLRLPGTGPVAAAIRGARDALQETVDRWAAECFSAKIIPAKISCRITSLITGLLGTYTKSIACHTFMLTLFPP